MSDEGPPRPGAARRTDAGSGVLARLDHLVYATPDLNAAIEDFETRTGVRPTPGGRHPGSGTRNALVPVGRASYLEIIGPDPEQPPPHEVRPFGIDHLEAARIATWAAKGDHLETLFADAGRKGIRLGEVTSGSRKRPDGVLLTWRYTDPATVVGDGIVPFFIDWGQTEHPSRGAARGIVVVGVRAEHPDADHVQKILRDLGLGLAVEKAARPGIRATLQTPRGRVELH